MAERATPIEEGHIIRGRRNQPTSIPSPTWHMLTGTAKILRSKGIIKEHLRIISELDPMEATKFVAQLSAETQP